MASMVLAIGALIPSIPCLFRFRFSVLAKAFGLLLAFSAALAALDVGLTLFIQSQTRACLHPSPTSSTIVPVFVECSYQGLPTGVVWNSSEAL
jgi:hypothetical protein